MNDMHKLGDQWTEIIDGQEHMVKAVEATVHPPCGLCMYSHGYQCTYPSELGECDKYAIKDLGILKDGLLPCPFCGEYPESFNKGNEYTKKRCSVMKCKKCNYELTVCAIYKTIDWCKQQAIYAWNRRV